MLGRKISGLVVDDFIHKTMRLRNMVDSVFNRVIVKATLKRSDIWEKETSK